MNIHPLWFICITIRLLLLVFLRLSTQSNIVKKNKILKYIIIIIPLIIGFGFLNKAITGSNNEYQIRKVFWHDTRIIHALFYISSTIALVYNYLDVNSSLLALDVLFSILYRIISNK